MGAAWSLSDTFLVDQVELVCSTAKLTVGLHQSLSTISMCCQLAHAYKKADAGLPVCCADWRSADSVIVS
jgi:hypothetical protein